MKQRVQLLIDKNIIAEYQNNYGCRYNFALHTPFSWSSVTEFYGITLWVALKLWYRERRLQLEKIIYPA